jgi:hypothetical protein
VLVALRLVFQYANDPASFAGDFFKVLSLAFGTVGALVASRRPRNPIGWIFITGALLVALSDFAEQYAVYTVVTKPGAFPGGLFMGWVRLWASVLGFYLIFTFTFLLFPNGRLLSKRWLPVSWFAAGAAGSLTLAAAFQPAPLFGIPSIQNPYGIQALADLLWLQLLLFLTVLFSVGVSAASVILRFRRARPEESQQLKWIALAAGLLILYEAVIALLQLFAPQYVPGVELAEAPVFVALPVSVGIAILKHHLYDIDLIIRRTLVYGALTGTLTLIYFSGVVLFQSILPFGSQASIVLSTLLIAAMFSPLRRRIQIDIDRRFFRQKYDAEKILAAFSENLRTEVELERLGASLIAVAEETLQPEQISLWLAPRS